MSEILPHTTSIETTEPGTATRGCDACGTPIERLDPFCPTCGREQALDVEPIPVAPVASRKHFRCKNCGAEVVLDVAQRSHVCAFCDSTYVVEYSEEHSDRQEPEFVIPFSITPERAHEQFRQWIGERSWFHPGDLKTARIEEKLRGVYLPFWSFSMLAQSDWSTQIGEYWYRTETYTVTVNNKRVTRTRRVRETEWWPLRGKFHKYHGHYLISGSRGLPQLQADQIQPYQLAALRRYRPEYLAGWLSEEYSLQRDEALAHCREEFRRRQEQNIATFLPGDTYRGLQVGTQFSGITSDLILLPVYLLSYRYNDKLYRFLLNGQTGKAFGNRPYSRWRIGIAVASGVICLSILILLFTLISGAS